MHWGTGLLDTPPGVVDTSPAPAIGGGARALPVEYVWGAAVAALVLVAVVWIKSKRKP